MLTLNEKAINNTFQIAEDFKAPEVRRSLYYSQGKSKLSLKTQPPGRIKIFSEEEIFLYKLERYRQAL